MEIYLTKMTLNSRNANVRRLLDYRRCQNLHKFVMQGFPNIDGEKSEVRRKFGVLHRLDIIHETKTINLLVQSLFKPVWDFASDELLDISQKEVGQIYSLLPSGTELMFRLRANPTKRVGKNFQYPKAELREEFDRKFKDQNQRRRIGIYSETEQIKWLHTKGEMHGFKPLAIKVDTVEGVVSDVAVVPEDKVFGSKVNKINPDLKDNLIFNSVVFNGNLQITDTEKFRAALAGGIGQGKAYGFGLLSIAKSLSL